MVARRSSEIQGFADALTAGDVAAIRSFLADDYYGHPRAVDEPSQADRWVALLPDVRAAMPDLHIEIEPAGLDDADGAGAGCCTTAPTGCEPTGTTSGATS